MSVKEIESAIAQLSPPELVELISWLGEHHAQVWDKTIEEDLESGRLDRVLAEVDAEYEAGLARPI
jgi:hypothetical protein